MICHDAHEMMYCCCIKLESVGFAYRHMFAVMKYANMKEISSGCILRRWTIWPKNKLHLMKTILLMKKTVTCLLKNEKLGIQRL